MPSYLTKTWTYLTSAKCSWPWPLVSRRIAAWYCSRGMNGSPLDPSAPERNVTAKAGFDCTKPVGKPFAERLAISDEVLARIDPLKIIGEKRWERIPVEPWG